jgi:predicted O-methyltransferase YrrM
MLLFSLANLMDNSMKYAEIGSRTGNSALVVKLAKPEQSIFCYDLPGGGWGGISGSDYAFKKNLSGFSNVNYFTGDSHSDYIKNTVAQNGPYDIFLVDGDHSDEGAYDDLHTAFASLKTGGVLVFDDTIHHPYLKDTFLRFCKDMSVKDYCLIES